MTTSRESLHHAAGLPAKEAFLALPSRAHAIRFLAIWAALSVEFVLVYAGADYITAHHHWRLRLYFMAELAVPLVPAFVFVYLSVIPAMLIAPFVLRSSVPLERLATALARVIALSGIAFVALPAEPGFPPVSQSDIDSVWRPALEFADQVNLTYNMVPSLHVALAVSCIGAYLPRAGRLLRNGLLTWIVAIAVSTLLTHQHHLLDVFAGAALGILGALQASGAQLRR